MKSYQEEPKDENNGWIAEQLNQMGIDLREKRV